MKPYIYGFRGCIVVYRVASSSTPRLTRATNAGRPTPTSGHPHPLPTVDSITVNFGSFELFKFLCTLAILWSWGARFIWVFSGSQDLYIFMYLQLTPQKRVGEVFIVNFFTRNEAKLNQGVSKDGQDHKLGDVF
jgi:hypothetical protein